MFTLRGIWGLRFILHWIYTGFKERGFKIDPVVDLWIDHAFGRGRARGCKMFRRICNLCFKYESTIFITHLHILHPLSVVLLSKWFSNRNLFRNDQSQIPMTLCCLCSESIFPCLCCLCNLIDLGVFHPQKLSSSLCHTLSWVRWTQATPLDLILLVFHQSYGDYLDKLLGSLEMWWYL